MCCAVRLSKKCYSMLENKALNGDVKITDIGNITTFKNLYLLFQK